MKRIVCLFVLILLFSFIFTNHIFAHDIKTSNYNKEKFVNFSKNQFENSFRYNIKGWVYVHIKGDPYNRGYQYGLLLIVEDHIDNLYYMVFYYQKKSLI